LPASKGEQQAVQAPEDIAVQDTSNTPNPDSSRGNKAPSTANITKLISVTEIIKREYLKAMDANAEDMVGLHQYNEIGYIENGEEEEDRTTMINRVLGGSKKYGFSAIIRYGMN